MRRQTAARRVLGGGALGVAAALAVSGCGVQGTSVNVYSTTPISVTTAGPSSDAPTTPTAGYPYYVYLLQPGNQVQWVKRYSATKPSLQDVVDSLIQQPVDQDGLYSDLTPDQGVPDTIELEPSSVYQQEYVLTTFPWSKLTSPAKQQLECTVWQWVQENRPATSKYQTTISLVNKAGGANWVDCWNITGNLPPGSPTKPAVAAGAGGATPSTKPTLPTLPGLTDTASPGT